MRIILAGQGPFGEKVLEGLIKRGENLIGVFSPPDKRGEAMRELSEKSGIDLFRPGHMKDPDVYDAYSSLKPD